MGDSWSCISCLGVEEAPVSHSISPCVQVAMRFCLNINLSSPLRIIIDAYPISKLVPNFVALSEFHLKK